MRQTVVPAPWVRSRICEADGGRRSQCFIFTSHLIYRRRSTMNQRLIATSALVSLLALGAANAFAADDAKASKEKCFGIAKAGQNDCANLSGSHSCAGQAAADNVTDDWKYVPKGTCHNVGGMTMDEVKMKMQK
jgi:uncharacterized membrane protein